MSLESTRAGLAELHENYSLWGYEPTAGIHHARVDDLKFSVSRGHVGIGAHWTVRHDRFGVIKSQVPADSIYEAKVAAVEFAQAWLNETEPV